MRVGELLHYRLKGNRVRIPGSPAAVSSSQTCGSEYRHCDSYRRNHGKAEPEGNEPEYLPCCFVCSKACEDKSERVHGIRRTRINDIDVRWRRRECGKAAERLSKCNLLSCSPDYPPSLCFLLVNMILFKLFANAFGMCRLSLFYCILWLNR